ncbi:hypothetical protein ACU686_16015 [Yinghuangia aomiensis]
MLSDEGVVKIPGLRDRPVHGGDAPVEPGHGDALPTCRRNGSTGSLGDARSDLYALGCVLHELLTGNIPFRRRRAPTPMMRAHLHDTPTRPGEHRNDVPAVLDDLALALLAKDPARPARHRRRRAPAPARPRHRRTADRAQSPRAGRHSPAMRAPTTPTPSRAAATTTHGSWGNRGTTRPRRVFARGWPRGRCPSSRPRSPAAVPSTLSSRHCLPTESSRETGERAAAARLLVEPGRRTAPGVLAPDHPACLAASRQRPRTAAGIRGPRGRERGCSADLAAGPCPRPPASRSSHTLAARFSHAWNLGETGEHAAAAARPARRRWPRTTPGSRAPTTPPP